MSVITRTSSCHVRTGPLAYYGCVTAQDTILLIEDNAIIAEQVKALLERKGYRVLHTRADFLLPAARLEQPAVILLGVDALGPSGGADRLVAHLRGDPRTAHILIMTMSSRRHGDAGQRDPATDEDPGA